MFLVYTILPPHFATWHVDFWVFPNLQGPFYPQTSSITQAIRSKVAWKTFTIAVDPGGVTKWNLSVMAGDECFWRVVVGLLDSLGHVFFFVFLGGLGLGVSWNDANWKPRIFGWNHDTFNTGPVDGCFFFCGFLFVLSVYKGNASMQCIFIFNI